MKRVAVVCGGASDVRTRLGQRPPHPHLGVEGTRLRNGGTDLNTASCPWPAAGVTKAADSLFPPPSHLPAVVPTWEIFYGPPHPPRRIPKKAGRWSLL